MAFGMLLALPFALTNPNVGSIDFASTPWLGEVKPHQESECSARCYQYQVTEKDHKTYDLVQ